MQNTSGIKLVDVFNIVCGVASFLGFLLFFFGILRLETQKQKALVAVAFFLLALVIVIATGQTSLTQTRFIQGVIIILSVAFVLVLLWNFRSPRLYRTEPLPLLGPSHMQRLAESEVKPDDLPELLRMARKNHPTHPRLHDLKNLFHRWYLAQSGTTHVFAFVVIEDARISARVKLSMTRCFMWVSGLRNRVLGQQNTAVAAPRCLYRRIGFTCVIPLREQDYRAYASGKLSEWDIGGRQHPIPDGGSPHLLMQAIELLRAFRGRDNAVQALLHTLIWHIKDNRGSSTEKPRLIANGNQTGEAILKRRGFACIVQADEEPNPDKLPIYELNVGADSHTNRAKKTIEILDL